MSSDSHRFIVSNQRGFYLVEKKQCTHFLQEIQEVRECIYIQKLDALAVADNCKRILCIVNLDGKIIDKIAFDDEIRSLKFHDGKIYGLLITQNKLFSFDIETRQINMIKLSGTSPRNIDFSPCFNFVFVTCNKSHSLEIIDLQQNKVIQNIKTSQHPYSLVVDNAVVFVTSIHANEVLAYNFINKKVLFTVFSGNHPTKIIKEKEKLYVTNFDTGKIRCISSIDGSFIEEYNIGGHPFDIISFNESFIVTDHKQGTLCQYNKNFTQCITLCNCLKEPHYVNILEGNDK